MKNVVFINMKKTIFATLTAIMLFGNGISSNALSLVVNDAISSDCEPYIENGRTMVPVRFVSEELGAKVEWISDTKQVKITKGDTTIILKSNENWAIVTTLGKSDKMFKLENKIQIKNDRTYAPIRFISEKLGVNVEWDSSSNTVRLTNTHGQARGVV